MRYAVSSLLIMKKLDGRFTLKIVLGYWLKLPDYTAPYFTSQYLLMLHHAPIFILYRDHRKSSEAHGGQQNYKVATQTGIQCIFQLMHEPVNEKHRWSYWERSFVQGMNIIPFNWMNLGYISYNTRSNFRQFNFMMVAVLRPGMRISNNIVNTSFFTHSH